MRSKPYPVGSPEAKAVVEKIRKQEADRMGLIVRPDGTIWKPRKRKDRKHD